MAHFDVIWKENYFMAAISLEQGEKRKIKLKISWDNHTFFMQKRNKKTQYFIVNRTSEKYADFELSC